MADAVVEIINKSVQKCPHCGSIKPKEVLREQKKINWSEFLLMTVFSFGINLFFFKWRKKASELVAHCSECNNTFTIEEV